MFDPGAAVQFTPLRAGRLLAQPLCMGAPNLKLLAATHKVADANREADPAQLPVATRTDPWRGAVTGCVSSVVTLAGATLLFAALQPASPTSHAAQLISAEAPAAPASEPVPAPAAMALVVKPAAARPAPPEAVGESYRQLWANHPWTALVAAQAAVAEAPQNVDAMVAEGFALFELHRDASALARVRKALSIDPKHPLANLLRGMIAQARHDPRAARAYYDEYLRRRPTGPIAADLISARQTLSPK